MKQQNEKKERQLRTVRPRVDVYEDETQVTITADMPGITHETAGIDFNRGLLTISGTYDQPPTESYDLLWAEFEPVQYQREFQLSDHMDIEKARAVVKQGVLSITLPKHEAAKVRKIEITTG